MRISVLVAVSENGVIGRDGQLPWRLPRDLRRFKELTMGHSLMIGRRTFDSIGRPLPGRRMVVISRRLDAIEGSGIRVFASFEKGFQGAQQWEVECVEEEERREVFVGGGAQIYQRAFPFVDRLYLTRIHSTISGDTFFPEIDLEEWEISSQESQPADRDHSHDFTFMVFDRKNSAAE